MGKVGHPGSPLKGAMQLARPPSVESMTGDPSGRVSVQSVQSIASDRSNKSSEASGSGRKIAPNKRKSSSRKASVSSFRSGQGSSSGFTKSGTYVSAARRRSRSAAHILTKQDFQSLPESALTDVLHNLLTEYKTKTANDRSVKLEVDEETGRWQCPVCSKDFRIESNMMYHIETMHITDADKERKAKEKQAVSFSNQAAVLETRLDKLYEAVHHERPPDTPNGEQVTDEGIDLENTTVEEILKYLTEQRQKSQSTKESIRRASTRGTSRGNELIIDDDEWDSVEAFMASERFPWKKHEKLDVTAVMNLATRARYRHPEPLFIKMDYGDVNDENGGCPSAAEVKVETERVELRNFIHVLSWLSNAECRKQWLPPYPKPGTGMSTAHKSSKLSLNTDSNIRTASSNPGGGHWAFEDTSPVAKSPTSRSPVPRSPGRSPVPRSPDTSPPKSGQRVLLQPSAIETTAIEGTNFVAALPRGNS